MRLVHLSFGQGVSPPVKGNLTSLLQGIAVPLGLRISSTPENDEGKVAGEILVHKAPDHAQEASGERSRENQHVPQLVVVLCPGNRNQGFLRFSESRILAPVLRGRKIRSEDYSYVSIPTPDWEILATADGKPVWMTRSFQGIRCDWVAQAEQPYEEEDRVFEHAKGHRFFRAVPFIDWLRSVAQWDEWVKPPPMASIMFDDPNLHSTTYGFLDFRALAREAEGGNFHVSFATVPIDAWYTSSKAARIVKDHQKRMGLLYHGFFHTFRELAFLSPSTLRSRAIQCLHKVQRLEAKTDLKVSPVMAPPHGGVSLETMQELSLLGFEAMCVTWGSIWSSNRDKKWTRLLGSAPGALIRGLGVIPRFRLAQGLENQILLSAYLNQPIIPVGHHWDVREGLDLLREVAGLINGIGEVKWADVGKMARMNYMARRSSGSITIRPLSRVVEVELGADPLEEVVIDHSNSLDGEDLDIRVKAWDETGSALACERKSKSQWVIEGPVRGKLRIEAYLKYGIGGECFRDPQSTLKALVRRLAIEARDRAMPFLPRSLSRGR